MSRRKGELDASAEFFSFCSFLLLFSSAESYKSQPVYRQYEVDLLERVDCPSPSLAKAGHFVATNNANIHESVPDPGSFEICNLAVKHH
jgi:hypothetical protein